MSADNGIYITQWNDGWRVVHAQAIENIDYPPFGTPCWNKMQWDYFHTSPLFQTEDEAWDYAIKKSRGIEMLEYGITIIGGNRGDFPTPDTHEMHDEWVITNGISTKNPACKCFYTSDSKEQVVENLLPNNPIPRSKLIPYSTWRHVKTCSDYTVLGIAHESTNARQPGECVVYISHEHQKLCVREINEFLDGRFLPLLISPWQQELDRER